MYTQKAKDWSFKVKKIKTMYTQRAKDWSFKVQKINQNLIYKKYIYKFYYIDNIKQFVKFGPFQPKAESCK